jgi:hypothetical protein
MTVKDQLEKRGPFWVVKNDSELKTFILDFLRCSWKTEKREYFPGPQPVSIERRHFAPHLQKKPYVVCEKSDGVRHVMLILTYAETKLSVLVNRAMEITVLPLSLPKAAHLGTVLDGELIDQKLFLIYDAVKVSGEYVGDRNLIERLTVAEPVVKGALKLATNPISLRMKTFFGLCDMEEFYTKYMPTLDYKSDGVIFTPVNEPIRSGTHETLFKWKPREMNTIDFLAKKVDKDRWFLYVQERGNLIIESELRGAPEWMTDGCIVECQYMFEENPKRWKPVGLRSDKVHPNNRRTFYNTLTNIKENIQWREFLLLVHR